MVAITLAKKGTTASAEGGRRPGPIGFSAPAGQVSGRRLLSLNKTTLDNHIAYLLEIPPAWRTP